MPSQNEKCTALQKMKLKACLTCTLHIYVHLYASQCKTARHCLFPMYIAPKNKKTLPFSIRPECLRAVFITNDPIYLFLESIKSLSTTGYLNEYVTDLAVV